MSVGGFNLLPLNRRRGFRGNVIANPVDAFDLVDDAGRYASQDFIGHLGPVRRHGILAFHDAEGHGPVVGSLIPHYAHTAHGQKHGEGLPNFVIPSGLLHFVDDHGIGISQDLQLGLVDGAEAAHGQPGAGEGLAPDHFAGQPEGFADGTDFVFEKFPQRLDELEFHPLGQAAHIVVRLDQGGGIAVDGHAFDDVGIKGALAEKLGLAHGLGGLLKNPDEFAPDDFSFLLGIGDPFEFGQEPGGSIHHFQFETQTVGENAFDALHLLGPHQAIVDQNADQLVANGPVDQGGGNAGIHPATEAEDDPFPSDLLPDILDGFFNERLHGPGGFAAADVENKILQDFPAPWRVGHFGMELNSIGISVLDHGIGGVVRRGHGFETLGQLGDFVAVAVPDIELFGKPLEEGAFGFDVQDATAVLAAFAFLDFAGQVVGQQLHAVANAEQRNAEIENLLVRLGGLLGVNTGGPPGKDQPFGTKGQNFARRCIVRQDFGINLALADAAGNDLGVLGTKVKDEDAVVGGHGGGGCFGIRKSKKSGKGTGHLNACPTRRATHVPDLSIERDGFPANTAVDSVAIARRLTITAP